MSLDDDAFEELVAKHHSRLIELAVRRPVGLDGQPIPMFPSVEFPRVEVAEPTPVPASHFLVINDEPYERSTIYGVYSTFIEARDDVERRTKAHEEDETGDNEEYSIGRAEIEEWRGAERVTYWARVNGFIWEEQR